MAFLPAQYEKIIGQLVGHRITLVAVSKTKPVADVQEAYDHGIRDFGENYVQEMVDKAAALPNDIRWHFIGHLQTNKVKYIAPFVHLIHGVDSIKLLQEINKQGAKQQRVIPCLLEVYISKDETKFGFDEAELKALLQSGIIAQLPFVRVEGLMGMATFTEDNGLIRAEFAHLKELFDQLSGFHSANIEISKLSMGMSADYQFAIENGTTMVRIGSLLFGERPYAKN